MTESYVRVHKELPAHWWDLIWKRLASQRDAMDSTEAKALEALEKQSGEKGSVERLSLNDDVVIVKALERAEFDAEFDKADDAARANKLAEKINRSRNTLYLKDSGEES